jgi:hypothetical protein
VKDQPVDVAYIRRESTGAPISLQNMRIYVLLEPHGNTTRSKPPSCIRKFWPESAIGRERPVARSPHSPNNPGGLISGAASEYATREWAGDATYVTDK